MFRLKLLTSSIQASFGNVTAIDRNVLFIYETGNYSHAGKVAIYREVTLAIYLPLIMRGA
jgi:hypothetical protein